MLTRPGSKPGPAWMRTFSESSAELKEKRRMIPSRSSSRVAYGSAEASGRQKEQLIG
jgi:hypothetical protein